MNTLQKISISVLIILLPLFCSGQSIRLDSLLNLFKKGNKTRLEEFRASTNVFKTYRFSAYSNILRIKKYYDDKEIKTIEKQYRATQIEVNKYLDTMLFFMKDPDYKYQFEQFNNQFEKALFSIRKLNTLFSKYDYDINKPTYGIFLDKPSTIKKVVKHTRSLNNNFGDYNNGIDIQGPNIIKVSYWCDWEDEKLILKVAKQERK